MIMAVIASAMAVLFVLHAETDGSSAEMMDHGACGEHTWYQYYSNGTLYIDGYGAMYDYNSVDDIPWHGYRDGITRIIIAYEVTSLGDSAFADCTNLEELSIPITLNSVKSDAHPAFAGCINIEKINITYGTDGYGYNYAAYPGSDSWYQNTPWYLSRNVLTELNIAGYITHIGNDAFRELNLSSLVIPNSVNSLGNHCFYNCAVLTDLTIPISLNSYGNADYPAFWGCMAIEKVTFTRGSGSPFSYYEVLGSGHIDLIPWNLNSNLEKTIIISDDVPSLGMWMFLDCTIKNLTLPVNCITDNHHRYAFDNCYDALRNVTITKGTGVGCDYQHEYATDRLPWHRSYSLQCITVEEGVTRLGDWTFTGCHAETLILPNSLGALGAYTFSEAVIKNLVIPISLNAVWLDSRDAFNCVSGLEKVTFTPGSGNGFDYAAYDGYNCCYKHTPWYVCRGTLKEIVFEDGIKSIGSDAFRELNIASLVIPDSVESLGCHAFYNCSGLKDLTVPITLNCIGSEAYPAFQGCNSIAKLRFTAGTDGVGFDYENCAPFWCTPTHKAVQITIDSGVRHIGDQTFAGYTFVGSDGEILEHTAECLSGHTFTKTDDCSYVIDNVSGGNQDVPATDGPIGVGCVSSDCIGMYSVVKSDLTKMCC